MNREALAERNAEMVAMYRQDGVTMQDVADRFKMTRARVAQIFEALGAPAKRREHHKRRDARPSRLRSYDANPKLSVDLPEDHEAVLESRALFRNTVVSPWESPRFLVSGENSLKCGKRVEKGPWAGMPVFTLTLEERATCPRSCHHWRGCYGNGMPLARRNDAFHEDFIPALKAEVISLVREVCATNPLKPGYVPAKGVVIRLHVLGDFFSPAYVKMWGRLLKFLPELHVFGYTARHLDAGNTQDYLIASEIQTLNERYPDRWAIRTSHTEPGAGRTIVVRATPRDPDVILCPEQAGQTKSCSTCALCWNRNAWDKTVAFLEHGMKRRERASRAVPGAVPRGRHVERNSVGLTPVQHRLHQTMLGLAENGVLRGHDAVQLCRAAEIAIGAWWLNIKAVRDARMIRILDRGKRGQAAVYQVFTEPQATFPPAPLLTPVAPKTPTKIPVRDGRPPTRDATPLVERKPDAPLVTRRPYNPTIRTNSRGVVVNPWVKGSADQFDIGTPSERIAALPDEERRRIADQYGVTVPGVEPVE